MASQMKHDRPVCTLALGLDSASFYAMLEVSVESLSAESLMSSDTLAKK
jgi:hypothetical protein